FLNNQKVDTRCALLDAYLSGTLFLLCGGVQIKRQLNIMSREALRLLFLASVENATLGAVASASLASAINKRTHFTSYLSILTFDEFCLCLSI
ncbi:hypothetical protein, partial [Psychromonas aquatilis]